MPTTIPGAIPSVLENRTMSSAEKCASGGEPAVHVLRYESFPCELVGFPFERIAVCADSVEKRSSLSVKQDVPGLMEQGKPELIVGLVPERECHHRLRRLDPPNGSAQIRFPQLGYDDECDACFRAELSYFRFEVFCESRTVRFLSFFSTARNETESKSAVSIFAAFSSARRSQVATDAGEAVYDLDFR